MAQQGGHGVPGRASEGRQAQDGGRLEVLAARRERGMGEEHRGPRHRKNHRRDGRLIWSVMTTLRTETCTEDRYFWFASDML